MTSQDYSSADRLLAEPRERVLAFVRQNADSIGEVSDFHWHAIAEVAAMRANAAWPPDRNAALEWATISVIVYDRLAQTDDPAARHSFGLSVMSLRSNMIVAFGPKRGHVVLDPELLEGWFFREAGMDCETAVPLVERWEDLPSSEQFKLLHLKHRFETLAVVLSKNMFKQADKLHQWEKLLARLP